LDQLLGLASGVLDGEIVPEPDDHDKDGLQDGVGDLGYGRIVYVSSLSFSLYLRYSIFACFTNGRTPGWSYRAWVFGLATSGSHDFFLALNLTSPIFNNRGCRNTKAGK
jgi:hypothetical protein